MILSLQLSCTIVMNVFYNFGQHRAVQHYHRKNTCYIYSLGAGEVFHALLLILHVCFHQKSRHQFDAKRQHQRFTLVQTFPFLRQCQDSVSKFLLLFDLFSLIKISFLQSAWLSNNELCNKWIMFSSYKFLCTWIRNIP